MDDNRQNMQTKVDDLVLACKEALAFVLRAVEVDYRSEGFDPAEHVTAKRLQAAIASAESNASRRDDTVWPARSTGRSRMTPRPAVFAK
jgi:hypothetical protein